MGHQTRTESALDRIWQCVGSGSRAQHQRSTWISQRHEQHYRARGGRPRMNVIDSSGWLEYFISGKNASFFAPAIQDVANVVVPTISIFEVFKRTLIEKGRTDALEAVAIMYDAKVVDLDREIALIA